MNRFSRQAKMGLPLPFTYLSDYAPLIRRLGLETDIDLPQSADLGFDLFLQGEGWSAPEAHAGGWFRWVGNTGAGRVRFLIDRSRPLNLQLEVFASVGERVLRSIQVFCDGVLVETRVDPGASPPIIEGVLPPKSDRSIGMTSLEVVSAETIRGQGEDTRELSIALQRLVVTPVDPGDASPDHKVNLVGELLQQFEDLHDLMASKSTEDIWRENLTYSAPILVSISDQPGYAQLKIKIEEARFGALSGALTFNLRRFNSPDLCVEFRAGELSPDFERIFTFTLEDEFGPRVEYCFTPDQRRRRWSLGPAGTGGEHVRCLLTALAIELEDIVSALGSKIDGSPVDWLMLAAEPSGYARGQLKEAAVGSPA